MANVLASLIQASQQNRAAESQAAQGIGEKIQAREMNKIGKKFIMWGDFSPNGLQQFARQNGLNQNQMMQIVEVANKFQEFKNSAAPELSFAEKAKQKLDAEVLSRNTLDPMDVTQAVNKQTALAPGIVSAAENKQAALAPGIVSAAVNKGEALAGSEAIREGKIISKTAEKNAMMQYLKAFGESQGYSLDEIKSAQGFAGKGDQFAEMLESIFAGSGGQTADIANQGAADGVDKFGRPPASEYSGKTIKVDTGKKYKSNGTGWTEVK